MSGRGTAPLIAGHPESCVRAGLTDVLRTRYNAVRYGEKAKMEEQFATGTPEEGETDPLISIIVPVYNSELYLRQCIESQLNQTLRSIEIICVNDGSTDGSVGILNEYALKDSRLRVISQKNRGIGATRNVGLRAARAPYIMFCDSDDQYEAGACERMLAAIRSAPDIDICICGTAFCSASGRTVASSCDRQDRDLPGSLCVPAEAIDKFEIVVWGKLFKREIILRYDVRFPEGILFEDGPFSECYLAHSRKAVYLNAALYNYRKTPGSMMDRLRNRQLTCLADHFKACEYLFEHHERWGILKQRRMQLWIFFNAYLSTAQRFARSKREERELIGYAYDYVQHRAADTGAAELPPLAHFMQGIVRKKKLAPYNMFLRIKQSLKVSAGKLRYDERWYFCGLQLVLIRCIGTVIRRRLFGFIPL